MIQDLGVATHISQHVVAQKLLHTGYNKCFVSEVQEGVAEIIFTRRRNS